jgi:hypothetical protein
MADVLGFPFEVGGPSSGSVTDLERSPSVITKRIPQSSGLLVRTMCGSRTGGWSLPCMMSD